MRREAVNLELGWTTEYTEYQSGGWKTLSLYNQSGQTQDTVIADGGCRETDLLAKMPATRSYLRGLGFDFMSVRIAKLEPRAFLWEHRDYTELEPRPRARLHVPLITNAQSRLIIGGSAIHMNCGSLWFLNPTERHGACNLGHSDRIHLILDVYIDESLKRLLSSRILSSASVTELPKPKQMEIQACVQQAAKLVGLGYRSSAEALLLKSFHRFSLDEGAAYNLIVQMYESVCDFQSSGVWSERKRIYLGKESRGTQHTRAAALTEQA
jgi:hypothetical protein